MKKRVLVALLVVLMAIGFIPIDVYAAEENVGVMTLDETRSVAEKEKLLEIYKSLFPNEYHYIEEYQENGIIEMDNEDIVMIFYGSEDIDNTSYELIVMSNGQIFTNYYTFSEQNISARAIVPSSGDFTVGTTDNYITFSIRYTIDTLDYDWIDECTGTSGSGFYLYPTNRSVKWKEDADGPAHYGYNNVSMNYDGSGVLYDIGVGVGNNKAKGITQISSGADMWLWAFLYAFFFS